MNEEDWIVVWPPEFANPDHPLHEGALAAVKAGTAVWGDSEPAPTTKPRTLKEIIRAAIQDAMARNNFKPVKAARELGIDHKRLRRWFPEGKRVIRS